MKAQSLSAIKKQKYAIWLFLHLSGTRPWQELIDTCSLCSQVYTRQLVQENNC